MLYLLNMLCCCCMCTAIGLISFAHAWRNFTMYEKEFICTIIINYSYMYVDHRHIITHSQTHTHTHTQGKHVTCFAVLEGIMKAFILEATPTHILWTLYPVWNCKHKLVQVDTWKTGRQYENWLKFDFWMANFKIEIEVCTKLLIIILTLIRYMKYWWTNSTLHKGFPADQFSFFNLNVEIQNMKNG